MDKAMSLNKTHCLTTITVYIKFKEAIKHALKLHPHVLPE